MSADNPVQIIADETTIIECEFPEWHLEGDVFEYLIDFNKTKKIIFKMGNGKSYTFSLVRVEDNAKP